MKKLSSNLLIILTITVLLASLSFSASIAFATSENDKSDTQSSGLKDSAIEKLAKALQKDQDNGEKNGGENWNKAIDSLGEEMGFPVDKDVEAALLNITEFHLDSIVTK